MVETKKLVPEVYYNRSRDFQLLGRVYDIIFNYLKTNSEILEKLPYSEEIDDKLIPLISTTLGFKQTHEYNIDQLRVLCSSFVEILRNKGNINSIVKILEILANVENSKEEYYQEITEDNPYLINIYLPLSISDTSLFEDMLYYVLPAGMSYRIIKEVLIGNDSTHKDVMFVSSDRATLQVKANQNILASQITQQEVNENMEKSAVTGIGRLEDMHIIQHPTDAHVQEFIVEDQTDSPEDVTLAPKDNE